MSPPIEYRDVLRLSRDQIREMLGKHLLAGPPADEAGPCQPMAGFPIVLLEIQHPNLVIGNYRVFAWTIGPRGIGVLHGKFTYPGSTCRVFLQTTDGDVLVAPGRVVRCRHLTGRSHEIGVAFDEPIDPSQVVIGAESAA